MPYLSDEEKDLYAALVDAKVAKLSLENFRDKDWIMSLWGGGNNFLLSFFIYNVSYLLSLVRSSFFFFRLYALYILLSYDICLD